MAMLHQGTKLLVILLFITAVVSCSRYKKYDAKEINRIRNNAISMSKSLLGEDEYNLIYNNMIDSINNWMNNGLGKYAYWNSAIKYQLDSVLCVNKERDKILTSVLLPYVKKGGVSDEIRYFYAVKVKGTWYFFDGATIVVSRGYYQENIHQPVSDEVLRQIATSNIYRSYLKKNAQGEWEINERIFERISSKNGDNRGYGGCVDCKTEEEYYMHLVERNWKNRK
jgi:hypothetical protein